MGIVASRALCFSGSLVSLSRKTEENVCFLTETKEEAKEREQRKRCFDNITARLSVSGIGAASVYLVTAREIGGI